MRAAGKNLVLRRPVKGRGFFAPRYSRGTHRLIRLLSGSYLKKVEGVGGIRIEGLDRFIRSLEEFHRGEKRLIILFRHPSRKDPPVLVHALNNLIPALARKEGRPLRFIPHARFLYGKDVLNWAGPAAAWAFPRLGHIPIQNLGANKEGMNLLRRELKEGRFPIAMAPEGQVTYHAHRCAPLTGGFASLAQWGLESGKDVLLLPVALGYKYGEDSVAFTRQVLIRWEAEAGRSLPSLQNSRSPREWLLDATEKTLEILEDFYRISLSPKIPPRGGEDERGTMLPDRIEQVCLEALGAAEQIIGLTPAGTILDRVFRIRYEGMGRLYTEGGAPEEYPLERNLADFRSVEARIFLRHSQIVDILEYIDPGYIAPPCPEERWCEYALNLLDVLNRLRGGDINSRYYPAGHKAVIKAGLPLSAAAFLKNGGEKEARRELIRRAWEVLEELSGGIKDPR